MSSREIRFFSIIGLLFGAGTLYVGATSSCACAEQTVGQTPPFNWFMAGVDAGLVIIVLSIVGMAFSFKGKAAPPKPEIGHPTDE